MSSKPLRVGLFGLGKMGRNHLRVLSMLKSVELALAFDVDANAATHAAAVGVPFISELPAGNLDIEAAVVCTPTSTHAEFVHALLARGVRKLFIEKPLADTLERAQGIVEACEAVGATLQVGFIERFNTAVQELKKITDRSQQVVSLDLTRTNRVSSRITDVDVITDLMIHDIDLALHINGPVVDVSAHGFCEGEMIDLASALLTHKNGRFSRIQASRITEKKIRMIQATCLDMFVDCDLLRKEILISRQSETKQPDGGAYVISSVGEAVEVRPQEALLLELQAFVGTCQGQVVPGLPDAAAGLDAQVICQKIREAVLR